MKKTELRRIALGVRHVVEAKLRGFPSAAHDWTDFGAADDLEGACGYASWGLWKALPGSTFVVGQYKSCTHSWVEFDGHIVDVTATQFDCKSKVRILLRSSAVGALYTQDRKNSEAETDVNGWYTLYHRGWKRDLLTRLQRAGLLDANTSLRNT